MATTLSYTVTWPQSWACAQKSALMVEGEADSPALSQGVNSQWLRELDLNQRPSGYEPDELPGCSIPRHERDGYVAIAVPVVNPQSRLF